MFATTQLTERPAPFLPVENQAGFEERKYLEQQAEDYRRILAELSSKSTAAARTWLAERGLDGSRFERAVQEELDAAGKRPGARTNLYEIVRGKLARQGVPEAEIPPRHAGYTPLDHGLDRIARKGLERLAWELDRYEPVAFSVYSGRTPDVNAVYAPQRPPAEPWKKGELEQVAVLAGGDPFSPTIKVEPGALSVVDLHTSALDASCPKSEVPNSETGRRKALAEWIAHPRHPLTARVMANRIWQWHFGRGLAGNPNNFGATGKKPTHPELLDWLAVAFVERGWSIKAMHRLLMSSAAYRRSAEHPDRRSLGERDPHGTSYAVFQPRRLTAEELRDGMLAVSGELNRTLGGIPIRPEINREAALQPRQVMGTFASAWQPSPKPADRHRRSIYALKIRGSAGSAAGGVQRAEPGPELRGSRFVDSHAPGLQPLEQREHYGPRVGICRPLPAGDHRSAAGDRPSVSVGLWAFARRSGSTDLPATLGRNDRAASPAAFRPTRVPDGGDARSRRGEHGREFYFCRAIVRRSRFRAGSATGGRSPGNPRLGRSLPGAAERE